MRVYHPAFWCQAAGEWTYGEQVEAIKDVSVWLDELKEESPEQPEDEE